MGIDVTRWHSLILESGNSLLATFGGIAGPALVYLGGCLLAGQMSVFADGWAVPWRRILRLVI